jgi:hypothetical protein
MTAHSQNGWPALPSNSPHLHTWVIPATSGDSRIRLRDGSAGFLLAVFALWFAEVVQPLSGKVLDDWGYADRLVRGSSSVISNHGSGTAMDLNATQHPLGKGGTFSLVLAARIRLRLRLFRGTLRWGGDYRNGRPDEMHVEIDAPLAAVEAVAQRLMTTPRGKRVLLANPGQREVILS